MSEAVLNCECTHPLVHLRQWCENVCMYWFTTELNRTQASRSHSV